MGLDMYLYKVNRKAKNQEELDRFLKILNADNEQVNSYKKYIETGNLDEYLKATFIEDFYDKYNNGCKDAVAYFDKFNEGLKVTVELIEAEKGDLKEEDIKYWRKHSDLHGFMQEIYAQRGGEESFNCIPLLLNKEDCINISAYAKEQLDKYSKNKDIKHTEGFFFGSSCEEDWIETIATFANVLATVDFDKETVYYSSWW